MDKPLRIKFIDMAIRRKEEDMFGLISLWEESEEDRAVFCKKHGLTVATFSYWRTKYRKFQMSSASQGFVELKPISHLAIEIVYPNGVIIRLPQLSTTSELKSLVHLV